MDNVQNKFFSVEINAKSKVDFDKCVTQIKENVADYGKIHSEMYSSGESHFNILGVTMFSAKMQIDVDEKASAYELFKHIENMRESAGLKDTYIKVEYIAPFFSNMCACLPGFNSGDVNEPTTENFDTLPE